MKGLWTGRTAMPVLRAAGLAVALLGLPITPPVFAGDFEDGMQFILNKDYPKAVESFKKAAAQVIRTHSSTSGFYIRADGGLTRITSRRPCGFARRRNRGTFPRNP